MLDLAQNFNRRSLPAGTEELARRLIGNSMKEYPKSNGRGLGTERLAEQFFVQEDRIALGSGATEIIRSAATVFAPDEFLILTPTFWEYEYFADIFEIPVAKISANSGDEFQHDLARVNASIRGGEVVFICNVNNPTSTRLSRNDLADLASDNRDTHFVVDETYLFFRNDFDAQSLVEIATKTANVHVVISLSKFFALPGVRLGALFSNKDTVERYLRVGRVPFSTSNYAQSLLDHVLSDKNFINKSREFYRFQRESFGERVQSSASRTLRALPCEGPFTLFELRGCTSVQFTNYLLECGVIVRGGHELDGIGEAYVRIAHCSGIEEEKLLCALHSLPEF